MGFVNEVKTHKYRTLKAICTSLCFTALGMHSGSFGPCLIDLSIQVGTTIDQITHILPTRAFGNMVGSTICGFMMPYFDHQTLIIFSLLSMSSSMFLIPLCTDLWTLYAVMLMNGMSGGIMVNAGKENSPFMQMAHFCFGIGAFMSPFIVEPFLKNLETSSSNSTDLLSNDTSPEIHRTPLHVDPSTLELKWAYFIIGSISIFIWIMFSITYLNKKDNKPHPTREVKIKEKKVKNNESFIKLEIVKLDEFKIDELKLDDDLKKDIPVLKTEKKIKSYHKAVIVLLAALFIHLAYGLELSFGTMLASYARLSDLQMSKTSASFVTSLYWGCFTFFRLCTLVMVNYVSARSMLILDLVLVMVANLFLLPFLFIIGYPEYALWIGSAVMGIGVSSIYPTLFSYLEEILPVTSKMNSIINSCACVGEFIVPVIIGAYIESWPNIYIIIVFIYSLLCCLSFALSCIWEYVINKYKRSS